MLRSRRASLTGGRAMQQGSWPILWKKRREDFFLSLYQVVQL